MKASVVRSYTHGRKPRSKRHGAAVRTETYIMHTRCRLYDTREHAQCSPTQEESCSPIISPVGISHEATPACREPPMRRYLRCPGAICCPARRALRAVLQPHIRFCDKLIADALSPLPRECGTSAHQLAAAVCSVRDKPRRCLRVRHRCPCAVPRGRSTGLGVAGFAIRSRRDRHRRRASPQSPNGPTRARLKPPGSPAATRTKAMTRRASQRKFCEALLFQTPITASRGGADRRRPF